MAELARKYDISRETVHTRAIKERWTTKRDEYQATLADQDNPQPAPPEQPADSYQTETRNQARDAMAELYRQLATESDPQRKRHLVAAIKDLTEVERILDDRPLPGSRRPPPPRARRATSTAFIPLDLAPTPTHDPSPTVPTPPLPTAPNTAVAG